jgi:NAD(P)-dependent dehydrogenase (short-subunit alcohol dehydrogenase family)
VFAQRYRGSGDPWDGELQASLTGTRAVIDALTHDSQPTVPSAIVVIASIASAFIAADQQIGYHVAKAGMVSLVRHYAVQLGKRGVRVNAVSSGPMIKPESRAFYASHPEITDKFRSLTPLGRMGTAEELADVVDYLCGSASSFITGQEIIVDGGLTVMWQASPTP